MAKDKKSFVLYADLIKSIDHLTNEEKGILFNHLLEYVNDRNPILTDRVILSAWKPIELSLKKDLEKYESKRLKNSESARMRWDKNNANACERIKDDAKHADNDNVNDNDNSSTNSISISKFSFKNSLLDYGFREDLVNDWLLVRKNKKSSNTETALKSILSEIEKTNCDKNELLQIIVSNSWSGFKSAWYSEYLKNINNGQSKSVEQTFIDASNSEEARNFKFS